MNETAIARTSARLPARAATAPAPGLLVATLVAFLAAVTLALAGCSPPSQGIPCIGDDDCTFGNVCTNGWCATGSRPVCHPGRTVCLSGEECTSGHCDEGCCAPTCASRLDCADDELCRDGYCQRRDSLPTCTADRDCAGRIGMPRCHPGYEMCVACLSDSDCGSDRACDGDNRCVAVLGTCAGDDDCPSSEAPRCDVESERCVACLGDDDCPIDQGCEDNACVARPVGCSQHSDCAGVEGRPLCHADELLCVACLEDAHCPDDHRCNPGTFECDALPGCGSDDDCVGDPGGPRCRFEDRRCVSCREDAHCDEGERCLSDHTCGRSGECGSDWDCEDDRPHCRLVDQVCIECRDGVEEDCEGDTVCHQGVCIPGDGCTSDGDCPEESPKCRADIGLCVECRGPEDCDLFKRCVGNACVPGGCSSHVQCAQEFPGAEGEPARPFCDEAQCVECLNDFDCEPTRVCWEGRCGSVRCESHQDCASFSGRGRCSGALDGGSGLCVECIDSADCGGGRECRDKVCVEPCTADADCSSGIHRRCRVDDGRCVQCVGDSDCSLGHACRDAVCVETGLDLPCEDGWWCADGQTCVESAEGGFPRCRQACDPYAAAPGCPPDRSCDVVGFDGSGRPTGACVAGSESGRGEGQTCSAQSSCAPHLTCVPESATVSRCRRYCDPAASTGACPPPLVCDPTVRLDADRVPRVVGLCVDESARTTRCDTGSDCREGQVCASGVPGDTPYTPASVCRWPAGDLGAGDGCASDAACRSGLCIAGAPVSLGALRHCQQACATDADCPGDTRCASHTFRWYDEQGFPRSFELSACIPACTGDFDCAANDTCVPVPNRERTHWTNRCTPRHPAGDRRPGERCQLDTQCWSGACLRHGPNATDGICLGACDPARNGADCSDGSVCPPEGVLFVVGPGSDGVSGNADDVAERTNVCWGPGCLTDADCRNLSNDPLRPRACAPEADPVNPDDLVLRCLPRYGNGGPGAYCHLHSDCASGLCVTWSNPAAPDDASQFRKRCFGGCRPPGGIFGFDECLNDTACRQIRWTDTLPNKALEVCVPLYPTTEE